MQKDSTILNTVKTLVYMSGMNDKEIEVVKCPHVTDFITITEGLHMSHFAYACKMRCPLNLVLENSKYLWFY